MNAFTIEKADEIHKVLKKYRKSSRFKFRGQSNIDWKLIPKAGRNEFSLVGDISIFRHWKRRAKLYVQDNAYTDWDYLAIAQHNGLPTRLLDWTHQPLTAAFFASIENPHSDGAIFVIKPSARILAEKIQSPFDTDIDLVYFYQPQAPTLRIANQFSYFTIHNKPSLDLNEESFKSNDYFEKIIIPKEIKSELIFALNHYGINYLTIYPDLEGLSRHLCWYAQNYQYWDDTINEDLEIIAEP